MSRGEYSMRQTPLESGEFEMPRGYGHSPERRGRHGVSNRGQSAEYACEVSQLAEVMLRSGAQPARPGRSEDRRNRAKVVVVALGARWPDDLAGELSKGEDTLVIVQRPGESSVELFARLCERIRRFNRVVAELIWVLTEGGDAQRTALEAAARFSASMMFDDDVRFMITRAGPRRPLARGSEPPPPLTETWLATA